jgi:hypothetical protein
MALLLTSAVSISHEPALGTGITVLDTFSTDALELDGIGFSSSRKVFHGLNLGLPTLVGDSLLLFKSGEGCLNPTGCAVTDAYAFSIRCLLHGELRHAEHARIFFDAESTVFRALDAFSLELFHAWLTLTGEVTFICTLNFDFVLTALFIVASALLKDHVGKALGTDVLGCACHAVVHAWFDHKR